MLIEERKFVFPNGEEAIIRSARSEDAPLLKDLREATAAETHFLAREPEDGPFNLERMKGFLDSFEASKTDFMINAFLGDQIVGDLGVFMVRPHLKYMHRGYLGMSIRQKYTGMGLGSYMMSLAIEQAKLNGFEQLELGVYSDNERARHLYEKSGFKEYGINPRAFKLLDGTYRDEIIMVNIFE